MLYFFFNDTATTEIYTLSLHDALPILLNNPSTWSVDSGPKITIGEANPNDEKEPTGAKRWHGSLSDWDKDRKSTRLNSSHANISYAVFCLKKKNNILLYTTELPPYEPC